MRKILSIILAFALLCAMGAALASEAIAISVTPLDYHTGRAISKPAYHADQVFRLRVGVDIPRFMDKTHLNLKWIVNGVEIDPPVKEADGYYYVEGIVLDTPASLTVRVEDASFEAAQTAEEMYNAMQNDRTTDYIYYFSGNAAPQYDYEITIPKTGDMSIIGPVAGIAACLALLIPRRRR